MVSRIIEFNIYLSLTILIVDDIIITIYSKWRLSVKSQTPDNFAKHSAKTQEGTHRAFNVVISLFDPQLDHICDNATKTDVEKCRSPILAMLNDPRMPIVTEHIVFAADVDAKAAERLRPWIEKTVTENIKAKIRDKFESSRLCAAISVEVIPVKYENIWDLSKCRSQIFDVLKSKLCEKRGIRTLFVNLVGGTTAGKTALFLSVKRIVRDMTNVKLGIIQGKLSDTKHPLLNYRYVSNRDLTPIGLLAQGAATKNPSFTQSLNRLEQVIMTSKTERILITGPTGAGKSELAKLIMAYMQTLYDGITEDNCIHQNVAAIAPSLIESELFGHEKDAFTGANKQHKGIFERADKGVVFLDEIGELPKHLQAKLLTVLDGVPFHRVGGTKPVSTNFLLLCGTNADLQAACRKGTFRQDLFERLKTWTVEVPPISDRIEDLETALQRERGEWRTQTGFDVLFEDDAYASFMRRAEDYRWPGNFREFHATFVHLAMASHNGRVTKDDIEAEFQEKGAERRDSEDLPLQSSVIADETVLTGYDLAEVARLACALDACLKCKTASDAGEMLFAARARAAREKETAFNGASSLQRLFSQFGLKAVFKHGACSIQISSNHSGIAPMA